MTDTGATELMPRQKGRPVRDIETDYQPVNWKRLFLAPKYLGTHPAPTCRQAWDQGPPPYELELTSLQTACWVVAIIALVLTVIITIKHDQVVAVSTLPLNRRGGGAAERPNSG